MRRRASLPPLVSVAALLAAGPALAGTVTITGMTPGPTPFIEYLFGTVSGGSLANAAFQITPMAGSLTRPITAEVSASYLAAHGALSGSSVIIPVFGLYAGTTNSVQLAFRFADGSSQQLVVPIQAAGYTDPCPSENTPTVINHRTATTDLDFDYMIVKDYCSGNAPAIFDTDGRLRWVGFASAQSLPGAFWHNGIYASDGKTGVNRLDLYGITTKIGDYAASVGATSTNPHNIDVGRDGLIVDINTATNLEAEAIEVDGTTGRVLNTWDMQAIVAAAMRAGGDDPSGFVNTDGTFDWFHMNSVAYNPADNTLIVSSRQNFVIDVDYDTPPDGVKKIHWILGDTTKKWAQYKSLLRYALAPQANTPVPIGQHAVSIDPAGNLLLFNDGYGSNNISPPGLTRGYSTVNSYQINTAQGTATGVYSYAPTPSLYSSVCGSAYAVAPNSHLVDFASAAPGTVIQGLGADNRLVFQMTFVATQVCGAGWNAFPIPSVPLQY